MTPPPKGSVVDLFCGAGALSHGFLAEGFIPAAGYDIDPDCRIPIEANNAARFIPADITALAPAEVAGRFEPGLPRILVAGAPCQPFSTYTQARSDDRWELLREVARIAAAVTPDAVVVENVAGLARFRGGRTLETFLRRLRASGLHVTRGVLRCIEHGIPQHRSRLVILAARSSRPRLPPPRRHPPPTVASTIGSLPPLAAGAAHPNDPMHRAAALSPRNLLRIRQSRPGGTWRDWEPTLVAACHRRPPGRNYSSVYGRMEWDSPSPTITTQYYAYGSGRFGHPEQDRALSLREGALLQTFPKDYVFTADGRHPQMRSVGRLVGNAVPVTLARALARAVGDCLGRGEPRPRH